MRIASAILLVFLPTPFFASAHKCGLHPDLHSAASPAQMKAVAEDVMGRTGGIGLYGWGIHVDTRPGYARWNG